MALLVFAICTQAADLPKAPVPNSPFIAVVYRYADAMLERGRDTYGPIKTGLLLSALDRVTLAPLTNIPSPPLGVRPEHRNGTHGGALTIGNPQHDENLLRLLYMLSELSGKAKYREAADAELKWALQQSASAAAGGFLLSRRNGWDVMTDTPLIAAEGTTSCLECCRPWLLWDRCFELAPQAARQTALKITVQQQTVDSLREAGFFIRTLALAYAHSRDEQFLKKIEELLGSWEEKRHPKNGLPPADTANPNARIVSNLSFAIDCDGAAHRVPGPLASRLRAAAAREDQTFCDSRQDLKRLGGFPAELEVTTGASISRRTSLWRTSGGGPTTAQIGMLCVSRYENSGRICYRELLQAAADLYLATLPGTDEDVWPMTVGQAISLELAAWRSTARQIYFDHARNLGNWAVTNFFDAGPLPRASLRTSHYEAITGADTLVLALAELHLHILHITAVRCPPNTIDR